MTTANNNAGKATQNNDAFGFDDQLPEDRPRGQLPVGDATFMVKSMRRVQKERGSLGTVWIAELKLQVTPHDGSDPQPLTEELVLHTTLGFRLYQFFASIGQYEHGSKEQFKPDWDAVPGSVGFCSIKHRPWVTKENEKRTQVEVDKWFDQQGRANAKDEPREMPGPF